VATPGALAALEKSGKSSMEFLARRVAGEIPEEDRKENQFSLEKGFRLLSSYRTTANDVVWVITEASRSHTTLLMPDEYGTEREKKGEPPLTTELETNAHVSVPFHVVRNAGHPAWSNSRIENKSAAPIR
jgi:hypothetical protein